MSLFTYAKKEECGYNSVWSERYFFIIFYHSCVMSAFLSAHMYVEGGTDERNQMAGPAF